MHAGIGLGLCLLSPADGAGAGLGAVLLANAFGHSRVCYATARDRLLPDWLAHVHGTRGSLWKANLALAAIAAVNAAPLPIAVMADIMSFGVAFMFVTVAVSLIRMRTQRPDLERRVRAPFGGPVLGGIWFGGVPVAAIVASVAMVVPAAIDIVGQARRGDWLSALLLGGDALAGWLIYRAYGRGRARQRDATGTQGAMHV